MGDGAWRSSATRGTARALRSPGSPCNGHPVLTDDLLVVNGRSRAGRATMHRPTQEHAERLGVGESLGVVGQRERWRLAPRRDRTGRCRCGASSRSAWTDNSSLRVLRGPERLLTLFPGRTVRLGADEPGGPGRARVAAGRGGSAAHALGLARRGHRAAAAGRRLRLTRARRPASRVNDCAPVAGPPSARADVLIDELSRHAAPVPRVGRTRDVAREEDPSKPALSDRAEPDRAGGRRTAPASPRSARSSRCAGPHERARPRAAFEQRMTRDGRPGLQRVDRLPGRGRAPRRRRHGYQTHWPLEPMGLARVRSASAAGRPDAGRGEPGQRERSRARHQRRSGAALRASARPGMSWPTGGCARHIAAARGLVAAAKSSSPPMPVRKQPPARLEQRYVEEHVEGPEQAVAASDVAGQPCPRRRVPSVTSMRSQSRGQVADHQICHRSRLQAAASSGREW